MSAPEFSDEWPSLELAGRMVARYQKAIASRGGDARNAADRVVDSNLVWWSRKVAELTGE